MTQEKQLLLKDLCARLPYNVYVEVKNAFDDVFTWKLDAYTLQEMRKLKSIKPYLRPMSSMTEEEKKELVNHVLGGKSAEFFHVTEDGSIDGNQNAEQDLYELNLHWLNFCPLTTSSYIDWLNAHHFDYRGLIDRGLAIEVTKDNNPYKD